MWATGGNPTRAFFLTDPLLDLCVICVWSVWFVHGLFICILVVIHKSKSNLSFFGTKNRIFIFFIIIKLCLSIPDHGQCKKKWPAQSEISFSYLFSRLFSVGADRESKKIKIIFEAWFLALWRHKATLSVVEAPFLSHPPVERVVLPSTTVNTIM